MKRLGFTRWMMVVTLATGVVVTVREPLVSASPLGVKSESGAVLDQQGNGISNTRKFRVPAEWRINYSFWRCQIPGFDIYVKGGPDDLMSTHGSSGHGTQYEHSGGTVYLTMNTACSWHVTVFPGGGIVAGPGLRLRGNGIANTMRFRVPSEWKINYTFWRCEIPGFDIYVKGDVDDIMTKSGGSGRGVQYEHSGGTAYLTMNTACMWYVSISQ